MEELIKRGYHIPWINFFQNNWNIISDILITLDKSGQTYVPNSQDIFKMFYLMEPNDIKVIIISQYPYQNNNACGIPFVTKKEGLITKSLRNIMLELEKEFLIKPKNAKFLDSWIKQGVFMINFSFSMGINYQKYNNQSNSHDTSVFDHKILWEEFTRNFIKYIRSIRNDNCCIPVILLGQVTWELDDEIRPPLKPIKVSDPREDSFIGCNVFLTCNNLLEDNNKILWI